MLSQLKHVLLLCSTAFAMEPRDHVFDTSQSYTHPMDSVVNILNLNPHQIAVAYTTSLLLLNHTDLNMIENPMEQVWRYSLPNNDNTIVAGPVSFSSPSNDVPNEVFIGDNEYNVYAIDIVTGKLKWMQALDPNIQAATRHMHLAVSPNGRAVVASAGDQVMALSIDSGSILFHRSFGPAVISTKFAFVAPPSGQTASLYATKMVFGDSSGVVRAMDLATGRKSWSWKFSTSTSSIVDLVLDKAGSAGVDVVVAVNQIGDLSAIRGDTGNANNSICQTCESVNLFFSCLTRSCVCVCVFSFVLWFFGSLVFWVFGSLVHWFIGSLVLWFLLHVVLHVVLHLKQCRRRDIAMAFPRFAKWYNHR